MIDETASVNNNALVTMNGATSNGIIDVSTAGLAELEGFVERKFLEASAAQRLAEHRYFEAGSALIAIRDRHLYHQATFEDYLQERWGFTRQRGHQLIQATEVASTVVDIGLEPPASERVAREFRPIRNDPEKLRDIYNRIDVPNATAEAVRAEVQRVVPPRQERTHAGRNGKAAKKTKPLTARQQANLEKKRLRKEEQLHKVMLGSKLWNVLQTAFSIKKMEATEPLTISALVDCYLEYRSQHQINTPEMWDAEFARDQENLKTLSVFCEKLAEEFERRRAILNEESSEPSASP